MTGRDIRLAHRVSRALVAQGLQPTPGAAQALEIAIDALDIGLVRPLWKAIMGYADEPGSELRVVRVAVGARPNHQVTPRVTCKPTANAQRAL